MTEPTARPGPAGQSSSGWPHPNGPQGWNSVGGPLPAASQSPRRGRRETNHVLVVVILLVAITGLTGAVAWYLLLSPPGAHAPVPSTHVALGSPSSSPRSGTPNATTPRSAAPSGRASASARSPAAGSSIDPQVIEQIDAVIAQVPSVRALQPTATVPFRFITRDQFATEFAQQFAKENPPGQLLAEESLDKRLGLLPPDADLAALAKELYTSQVLAFYDPATKDFTVIASPGAQFTVADRVTVAHEYDHALQDQHWDLQKLQKIDPGEGDRATALSALAEGDATAVMYQWASRYLSPGELATLGDSASPNDQQLLASMPLLLRQSLSFPYISGLQYISSLEAAGGWDAVNAAWDKPPVSSEQVMHPEKYTAGETPISIALPDVAAALGSNWKVANQETEGELVTGIWLADGQDGGGGALGLPAPLPNADAAAGWGGDRVANVDGPNGTWAVVWQTAWDTPQDAQQFVDAATSAMSDLAGSHQVTATSIAGNVASPELVLVASDEQTMTLLKSGLGIGG